MTRGKFGLSLPAIAVIAFGFAALRQPTSVLLVCGFALLAQKDEWLNRQAMQALLLTICYYLAELVMSWIFGGLARFFGWVRLYSAVGAMSTAGSFVSDILYLALIVLAVLAAVRVLRGRDAGLPFIARMAGGDFSSAIKQRVGAAAPSAQAAYVHTAPPQAQYAPPVQAAAPVQTQYAPPVQAASPQAQYIPSAQPVAPPSAPAAAAQASPEPTVRLCPACSAPVHEDSRFCTECGAKTQ